MPIIDLTPPPRIRIETEGDTLVLRYAAAATPGKLVAAALLVGLVAAVAVFVDFARGTDDTALIVALFIPVMILADIVLLYGMRALNITTIRLSRETLTRRVGPISLGRTLTIARAEVVALDLRWQRPASRSNRPDGIRINNRYDLRVRTPDDSYRVVKDNVRGKRHALYLAYRIADHYGLRENAERLRTRYDEAASASLLVRRLAD